MPVFGGAFVLVAAMVLVATRWRRLSPLSIGALLIAGAAVLTGQLGALLAIVAFGGAATVLGRLVLRRFPDTTDLEALLLGLVLHGTVVGLMVAWPINYPGVHVALVAAPLVCGWRQTIALLQRAWTWVWASERRAAPLLPEVVAIAIAAIGLVHFLVVLMPEFGHDALVSHLMMPARIAWRHVWEFDVDSHVWCVMPALVDWLYTVGYMLAGETGARLVNFGCILLLGRLVFDVVQWLGGDRLGGLVAVLVYLTTPLTLTESSSLFIEAAWTCFVVGGAMAVLRVSVHEPGPAANDGDARQTVLAGALLGGALAAKAVTFMVLPVLALVLLVAWRRWLRRGHTGAALVGLGVFLFVGSQPYVRALWLTGNPVFPFFNGYFRSPHYALENFAAPDQFPRGLTWDVLYRMTFASSDYLEALPGAAGFQWLLLVVPVAVGFVVARHRRGLLVLGVGAAIAWLTCKQTAYLRYVFPTFALASAAIGALLGGALPRARASTMLLAAATVATVTLNLVCFATGGFNHAFSLPVLASPSLRNDYIAARQPLRAAVRLVNELNEQQAPVAFFSAALAADLRADLLCPNWYNFRFAERLHAAANDDALGELLARERVRFLVLADHWEDEPARQRVRAVSREVRRLGDVSVRRLDERFQFRRELLQAPAFERADAWQLAPGARIEPGVGAVVRVDAAANQLIEVAAGREYRLTATARLVDAAVPASARLQVNWIDARGRMLAPDIQVFACSVEATSHSMDVVAPPGAATALVYASGFTQVAVVFTSLSFKN